MNIDGMLTRLGAVGARIPHILEVIVKLIAVLIFIWYFEELTRADYMYLWPVRVGLGLSLLAFLWLAGKVAWIPPPAAISPGSGGYVILLPAPLAVVALLTALYPQNHDFHSALINASAEHQRSFWKWISQ